MSCLHCHLGSQQNLQEFFSSNEWIFKTCLWECCLQLDNLEETPGHQLKCYDYRPYDALWRADCWASRKPFCIHTKAFHGWRNGEILWANSIVTFLCACWHGRTNIQNDLSAKGTKFNAFHFLWLLAPTTWHSCLGLVLKWSLRQGTLLFFLK